MRKLACGNAKRLSLGTAAQSTVPLGTAGTGAAAEGDSVVEPMQWEAQAAEQKEYGEIALAADESIHTRRRYLHQVAHN